MRQSIRTPEVKGFLETTRSVATKIIREPLEASTNSELFLKSKRPGTRINVLVQVTCHNTIFCLYVDNTRNSIKQASLALDETKVRRQRR